MRLQTIVPISLCLLLLSPFTSFAKTSSGNSRGAQDQGAAKICKNLYQKPSRKAFDACRFTIKTEPLNEAAWQRWAQLHYRAGLIGKAERYFSKALLLARDFGNDQAVALALNGLARSIRAKGALSGATDLFLESTTFCHDDMKCLAGNQDGLGYIFLRQRKYAKARKAFAACSKNAARINNAKLMASCKYGLATVYFQQKKVQLAHTLCNESFSLYREANNQRGMAAALGCLASTAKNLKLSKQQWCAYKTSRAQIYRELGEQKKSLLLERGIMRSKCKKNEQ